MTYKKINFKLLLLIDITQEQTLGNHSQKEQI
jgi:hypothetical protein